MRIVGGPENLVRANVLRERVQAPLDWLKEDPAVPLEQLAGPGLQSGVVKPLVVEMAIHAIQPGCDPAPTGLQKADAPLGETFAYTAPNDTHGHEHHLHGVRDDVPGAPALEAINADGGHATGTAFVEADGEVEFLRFSPERIIGRVSCHTIVIRIGAQEAPAHAQCLAGK